MFCSMERNLIPEEEGGGGRRRRRRRREEEKKKGGQFTIEKFATDRRERFTVLTGRKRQLLTRTRGATKLRDKWTQCSV